MTQAAFWAIWLLIGFVSANAWLSGACPHAGCSGILIAMQVPVLLLGAVVWLGSGVAVSIFLARRGSVASGGQQGNETTMAHSTSEDGDLDDDAIMKKYGITFDGERYSYGTYQYDRLSDAANYARLVAKRGHA